MLSLKSKNKTVYYHNVKNSEILKPFKSYQVSASLRTGNAFNVQSMKLDHQTKILKIKFSLYMKITEGCQKR